MKHALLGTLPGRVIVIGLSVRAAAYLVSRLAGDVPAFVSVADTVASAAIAVGAIYFSVQLLVLAKRRLLWRVRRKLIVSYIFIGFVPALLIVGFFVLCGLLLFFNFSSYLVQTELRNMEDRARFLATATSLEIQHAGGRDVAELLARRQQTAAERFPGVSLVLVPVDRTCAPDSGSAVRVADARPATAGPWAHVEPPRAIPAWIGCDGYSGLMAYTHAAIVASGRGDGRDADPASASGGDTHMFVRAVVFPESPLPGYAIVADLVIGDQVKRQLQRETGVELRGVSGVNVNGQSEAAPIAGRPGGDEAGGAPATATGPLSWVTFLDYRVWETGAGGTLLVSTQLSLAQIYDRIVRAQGLIGNRSFGQTLLTFLLVIVGGLFLVIEVVALIVGFALAKSITGSVHELFEGTERVRQGDFTHKIAVKAADQLGELANSFNSMTASIEDLLLQAAEKKRLEEELRIAHEIQMSLLPQGPLLMPGLSVTALCVPAREVGGDYYDFLPLDDHRVGVLIADVSGKGTSAALYMAELKGLVLSLSRTYTSPRELLIMANRIIADHLDARSFITMTYAVIDLQVGTMTYARAGHTPLIYVPGADRVGAADGLAAGAPRRARILAPDGLVLGLKLDHGEMFDRLLDESVIPLVPGDLYLFFTDGITEAMNASDECFGDERLAALLEQNAELPSQELRERVLREIESFVGGASQHDDMTMLLLKVDAAWAPLGDVRHEPVEIANRG